MLNGGVVKASAPYPIRKGQTAIRGAFSGGIWTPDANWVVTHYREYRHLGTWRVTGVGHISRATDTLMIVAPETGVTPFQANDVLVIGDGTYTELSFDETNLELLADGSVEIGSFRAIALLDQPSSPSSWIKPKRAIIFHELDAKLPQGTVPVRWGERLYQASFSLPDSYVDDKMLAISDRIKRFPVEWRTSMVIALENQIAVFDKLGDNTLPPKELMRLASQHATVLAPAH